MPFQIVDAFASQLFGGNPAGVVLLAEGEEFPAEKTMIQTAAELRYSETVFLKPLGPGKFQARYFTPAAEVDLCGHATIGSAHALVDMGVIQKGQTIQYETLSGPIAIQVGEEAILMDMASPKMGGAIVEFEQLVDLYRVMGLEHREQGQCHARTELMLVPKLVSTGLMDIMLPVKDEAELERIAPDFPALSQLSERYQVVGVHAFTINTQDGCVYARNFAPLYDIDEEAATGTSNGALAYYLYDYGLLGADTLLTVIQGEKMGRPSQIQAQISASGETPKVRVGGTAVTLARGEILL